MYALTRVVGVALGGLGSLIFAQENPSVGTPQKTIGKQEFLKIAVSGLFAGGSSTVEDEYVRDLQGGGHDFKNRGFNIQGIEFSFTGEVDPYFSAQVHTLFGMSGLTGESFLHLEEAFVDLQRLPWGLGGKVGLFLTHFGRMNALHAHSWTFLDQPVVLSRTLGAHGAAGLGAQLSWLLPTPFYWNISTSLQNASGETMVAFGGIKNSQEIRPFQDRGTRGFGAYAWTLRNEMGGDWSDSTHGLMGLSMMSGPNSFGQDTYTQIYGADFTFKWKPSNRAGSGSSVVFQTEGILRNYFTDPFSLLFSGDGATGDQYVPSGNLTDLGLYAQLVVGFSRRWSVGTRFDLAGGNEDSLQLREFDPMRSDRVRFSPMLAFHPTEFSRIRAQYNLDWATHLETFYAHSFWIGVDFTYGEHAAHQY